MADVKKTNAASRRGEITETATALFLEKGFAGTSMSDLAQACGIRKASLYHHFPGKEDLFIACVTEGYSGAMDEIAQIYATDAMKDTDKIRATFDCLYHSTIEAPVERLSPLIAEVSRSMPNVARSFNNNYIELQREMVEKIILAGVENGAFLPQDIDVLLHLIFGPIVTLSLSREMFATFDDIDERYPVQSLKDGHVDTILRILTEPAFATAQG